MAAHWVKSLQCKSKAFEDVYHPNPKNLIPGASCRKGVQSLKDVIETTKHKPRKPKPPAPKQPSSSRHQRRARQSVSARPARPAAPFFPALAEMPEGHPSRNVVEIIFHTSWSPKAFSGRIEMIFKVQNLPRTVTRFEEYREMVKSRAGSGGGTWEDDARCVADGNEVMRFHCLGPTSGGVYDGGAAAWQIGLDSLLEGRVGFDSVSGDNGELLVFDPRAVLPCFLIIYKL
ncbi:unnamed protein product, partial [Vitis vinifera]